MSNPVPVNKKQGMIRVCTDFRDFEQGMFQKIIFQHHSLTRSLMNVLVAKPFLSWTVFRDIIKSKSNPEDQHKTDIHLSMGYICTYRKMPFGLKNDGATFQRAMYFDFHDLKHIVEAYLDDLASRSHKRTDHPTHL